MSSIHHLLRLGGVHRHRLFAEHGLAVLERSQHIAQVQGVWSSDENRVHLRAGAQGFSGIESVRDAVLRRGCLRIGQAAAGESCNLAMLSEGEPGHYPLDGVKSKTNNAKSDH